MIKGDPIFGLLFMEVGNTYTDPCQCGRARPAGRSDRRRPRLGVGRPARLERHRPDRHHRRRVRRQAGRVHRPRLRRPAQNVDDCADGGHFMLLEGVDTPGDGYWAQGPNQHHQLWILDVDGTRLVIVAMWFPDTSAQDRADIDEIAQLHPDRVTAGTGPDHRSRTDRKIVGTTAHASPRLRRPSGRHRSRCGHPMRQPVSSVHEEDSS